MPNCFSLTKKGQATPSLLSDIDEELCALLGKPVHPKRYVIGWVGSIGFALACGKDWAWIREIFQSYSDAGENLTEEHEVLDYLETNYTPDAWAEIGGRR